MKGCNYTILKRWTVPVANKNKMYSWDAFAYKLARCFAYFSLTSPFIQTDLM